MFLKITFDSVNDVRFENLNHPNDLTIIGKGMEFVWNPDNSPEVRLYFNDLEDYISLCLRDEKDIKVVQNVLYDLKMKKRAEKIREETFTNLYNF